MTLRVSFVVPVKNDAARLEICLRSIRANERVSGPVEIVVVDNGSTDGSAEVARRFRCTVVSMERGRVSELRNAGARATSGDVLAFIDADNEIVSTWVYGALTAMRQADVGAAGALYHAPMDGTWVQRSYGHLRGRTVGQQEVLWLGSGNLVVRRGVFEAIGGFDPSLRACEDVDLCARIRARGLRVVGDARLESVHHGDPKTLGELFVSELWRGRDNLRVTLRSPFRWTALPSAMVPVIDVLMIVLAIVGVAAALVTWTGLVVAVSALLVFAGGACLKVVRAAMRQTGGGRVGALQAFAVSCVYDLGRALALVFKAEHRGSQPRQAATAS